MKRLIVEEVQSFRAEVRHQARAGGQIRRNDSLPIPSREEIQNSPTTHAPPNGATSGYTVSDQQRPVSPVTEDPSAELEKELASTHLGSRR